MTPLMEDMDRLLEERLKQVVQDFMDVTEAGGMPFGDAVALAVANLLLVATRVNVMIDMPPDMFGCLAAQMYEEQQARFREHCARRKA